MSFIHLLINNVTIFNLYRQIVIICQRWQFHLSIKICTNKTKNLSSLSSLYTCFLLIFLLFLLLLCIPKDRNAIECVYIQQMVFLIKFSCICGQSSYFKKMFFFYWTKRTHLTIKLTKNITHEENEIITKICIKNLKLFEVFCIFADRNMGSALDC